MFLLVVYALIDGIFAWFRDESLASYGKNLAWLIAIGFVYWLVAPYYYEFRNRTKEIDGKVTAIEEALNKSTDGQMELMERLAAIERKLAEMQNARQI